MMCQHRRIYWIQSDIVWQHRVVPVDCGLVTPWKIWHFYSISWQSKSVTQRHPPSFQKIHQSHQAEWSTEKAKKTPFHSLQDLNMVATAFPPQDKMETQQQFVTPKVLEVMDAAWWAERRQGKLGKHTGEHRWARRRKKQTIWQPLLPDVHWSPVLNELHKQNGPLGREKGH